MEQYKTMRKEGGGDEQAQSQQAMGTRPWELNHHVAWLHFDSASGLVETTNVHAHTHTQTHMCPLSTTPPSTQVWLLRGTRAVKQKPGCSKGGLGLPHMYTDRLMHTHHIISLCAGSYRNVLWPKKVALNTRTDNELVEKKVEAGSSCAIIHDIIGHRDNN
eukprot:1143363-Pelagomonas_calceolata.AAC.5